MSRTVIKIENLSKSYRLGEIGTGTLSHDLNRAWARIRGKEDPFQKVGTVNDRTQKAEKGEIVSALKDINLEVKEGEVLGIIGKNGAGKSTLLKVLSRVTSPTTGSLKVKGRLASLLEVGTGFHPEMTGRENIYMNGTIMGMRKWEIDKKLDEIVDFAGVAKYLDTPVKRYSSGMSVRLGFAVAAFLEPEILVVDEVLAVGDADFQRKAVAKMQDVSYSDGRTVLFVSHNMSSIQNLCTSCATLNNGEIVFKGDAREAIDFYFSMNQEDTDRKNSLKINKVDEDSSNTLSVTSISFSSDENTEKPVYSGDRAFFKFVVDAKDESQVSLRLDVHDSNDDLIFICNSFHSNVLAAVNEEKVEFICEIEKFPLYKGEYCISISLFKDQQFYRQYERVMSITVVEGDFHGTGKIPPKKLGKVLISNSWKTIQYK